MRKLNYEPFTDSTAILGLEGEWDFNGNDEFTEAVAKAVAAGRTHLVIDLGAVEYLDSSMLGSLLGLQKMAEVNCWPVAFVRPRGKSVWRLFELTALEQRFDFYADRTEALFDTSLPGGAVRGGAGPAAAA